MTNFSDVATITRALFDAKPSIRMLNVDWQDMLNWGDRWDVVFKGVRTPEVVLIATDRKSVV